MRLNKQTIIFLCIQFVFIQSSLQNLYAEPKILNEVGIDHVWSGHPVGFDLITHKQTQYAAYYNANRQMVIASRNINDLTFTYQLLPSHFEWDSHNYITMAFDRSGILHVSGNMHVDPLVYFRSELPGDILTLKEIHRMTGMEENRVTYPHFFYNEDGGLLYMYRDGSSGNGHRYINRYDEDSKTWSRYLDTPLLDGLNHNMNAYPVGIKKGIDGWFHLLWMWRDTPDCDSNHDISYARSKDLIHWETIAGDPLTLPITYDAKNTIVDPVPVNNGLINMGFGYGFDHNNKVLIQYHKYDEDGNSQIYIARWEKNQWKHHQISNWDYRWEFGGNGSVPCDVRGSSVKKLPNGNLAQSWTHKEFGSGTWELHPDTLEVIGLIKMPNTTPLSFKKNISPFPGMEVKIQSDRGKNSDPKTRYVMRWETLPPNRDRAREGNLPEPSLLKLFKLSQ